MATLPKAATATLKKLYPKDWLEIVNLVKTGFKVPDIADIHQVSVSVIYRGLKRRGINLTAIAIAADAGKATKARDELISKIRQTKEKDYKFTEFLQQQLVQTIVDKQKKIAIESAGRISDVLDDIKTLKIALDGVRVGTDNKFRILGIEKDNENVDKALPELPIRMLSEDETAAMRDRQEHEDGVGDEDLEEALNEIELDPEDIEEEGLV